jgi:non-specific serine/threonine protein kinase
LGPVSLPATPTPFVGRERDLAEARALLRRPEVRLLTLTGPPGIGKTRLAIELARTVAAEFDRGPAFMDLAPLPEPGLVLPAAARALGIRPAGTQPSMERLARALRDRRLLLVLDNFEHLLDAAVDVGRLLAALPDLKVLATSREPLRLRWEHQMAVPPLAVPDPLNLPAVERFTTIPSVALLLGRAKAADHSFQIEAGNARAIAGICVRLDGLPLALELAAPALPLLTPQAVLERLDRRLSLLSRAARDLPERHRTLRAAVGWSYALLSPEQQAVFRRLGVFSGGWTLEAAAAVCAVAEGEVLEAVTSLCDKSLVEPGPSREQPRFRMLETLREFALEQLEVGGERRDAKRRHALHFLALAEQAEPGVWSDPKEWLARLEQDHDNLRAALGWAAEYDAATGLRLGAALWRFWEARGHLSEGLHYLEHLLPLAADAPANVVARAYNGAGNLARDLGDYARAAECHRQALALRRGLGEPEGIAGSLNNLANVLADQDDYQAAMPLYEESLARCREIGATPDVALLLHNLGAAAAETGQSARAAELCEESLAMFRGLGSHWGMSVVLNTLAKARLAQGDPDRAASLAAESLTLYWGMGIRQGLVERLETLADVAIALGYSERAARLLGACEALRREIGAIRPPDEQKRHARRLEGLRREIAGRQLAAASAAGEALSVEAAVTEALSVTSVRAGGRGKVAAPLTDRERQIAAFIAEGLTNRDVADRLHISQRTVDAHVQHILNKLNLRSRAQIAAWAAEWVLARGPQPEGHRG